MKTIIFKTFSAIIFISLVFFSTTVSKCEAGPELIKEQAEAQYVGKRAEVINDAEGQDDDNSKFKMLVGVIKENLVNRYQQLDALELAEGYVQFFELAEMIN